MNYQPFYNMNILISDDLLASLQANQFALLAFIFAGLFAFAMIVIVVNDLIRHALRAPTRNYPPHVRKVASNE